MSLVREYPAYPRCSLSPIKTGAPVSVFTADRQTLCDLVPRLRGRRVLVIGDVMLDVYLEGDAERISPEAPVPVVNIRGERCMLGGAANVAHNIRTLGGEPHLVGLCGAGPDGARLEQLLEQAGIHASLLHMAGRKTSVKTRVMARGQQMLRLDKEAPLPLASDELHTVGGMLEALLPLFDVVVLSDYAKGMITPALGETLRNMARALPRPPHILADPKPHNAACYEGVGLMTPNRREAAQLAGMELRTPQDIQRAGRAIMARYGCRQLLITLGGEGMALFMRDGTVWNIPTAAKAVFDVTGAGDTVIATVALGLAAGAVLPVACALANCAAGGAVERVGVVTLDSAELLGLVRQGSAPQFILWP